MKPNRIHFEFRTFAAVALLGWGLAVSGWAQAKPVGAPPPPPAVNPAAPPGPAIATAAAPVSPVAAGAQGSVFNADAANNSSIAAPSISDDQQIKNAMDMVYDMYHAEDYDAVVKSCAAILDKYPKKKLFWVLYLQALAQEEQEMYLPAIDGYKKVKRMDPNSTYSNAASFRIGLCQVKSGQKEEAIYTLRDIIENNPRSEYRLQAYLHLGDLYRDTRDWKAAARIYKDMIRYYPNTSWAWTSTLYLAETHAHQGDVDGAVRIYQVLIRDPRVPTILRAQSQLRVGDLYISDKRWLEALETYREALRDFANVPGVEPTCKVKMKVATEGRRWNRVPYRQVVDRRITVNGEPSDEDYNLKKQHELIPYQ